MPAKLSERMRTYCSPTEAVAVMSRLQFTALTDKVAGIETLNEQLLEALQSAPCCSAFPEHFPIYGDPAAWMADYAKWYREVRRAAIAAAEEE